MKNIDRMFSGLHAGIIFVSIVSVYKLFGADWMIISVCALIVWLLWELLQTFREIANQVSDPSDVIPRESTRLSENDLNSRCGGK